MITSQLPTKPGTVRPRKRTPEPKEKAHEMTKYFHLNPQYPQGSYNGTTEVSR